MRYKIRNAPRRAEYAGAIGGSSGFPTRRGLAKKTPVMNATQAAAILSGNRSAMCAAADLVTRSSNSPSVFATLGTCVANQFGESFGVDDVTCADFLKPVEVVC